MPTFFNLTGFARADPLDGGTAGRRFAIFALVTWVVTSAELFVAYYVLDIARLEHTWLFFAEIAFFTLPFAWVVLSLRKASSLLPILLVAVPFLPLDFYLDTHVRSHGMAWWMYGPGTLLSTWPPLARTLFIGIADGFFAGPVCLFVARVVARWVSGGETVAAPTDDQRLNLFRDDQSEETVARPPRDIWFWIPRLTGISYVSYLALVTLGAFGASSWPGPVSKLLEMSYANPALTINTYQKVALIAMVAFVAAYNRELRWHAGLVLVVAHVVSSVGSIAFALLSLPSAFDFAWFLPLSAVTDALLLAALVAMTLKHRSEARRYRTDPAFPETFSLPYFLSRTFYRVAMAGAVAMIVVILVARLCGHPYTGFGAVYGGPDALVCNSLTKYAVIGLLAYFSARNTELREIFGPILATGFAIGAASSALWPLVGPLLTHAEIEFENKTFLDISWQFAGNVILDGASLLGILLIRRAHYTVDLAIGTLSPTGARGLQAVAQGTLAGGEEDASSAVDPRELAEIVKRTDRYFGSMRGRKRAVINAPFALLESALPSVVGLYPALSAMSAPEQAFWLRRHLFRTPWETARSVVPPFAELLGALGLAAHGIVTLARYSTPRGGAEIGFVPSDARDRLQGEFASRPPPYAVEASLPTGPDDPNNLGGAPPPTPLVAPRIYTPIRVDTLPVVVDYLVVGSGAGGAVAAYRLASADRDAVVLVVEAGARYSPPRDYTDDELEMFGKLYKEGGLQQTKRADLVVLQGEAVGGSTVVNNAICVPMPDEVRDAWATEYGLDKPLAALDAEYQQIAKELGIATLPPNAINAEVATAFKRAIKGYNAASPADDRLEEVSLFVNMRDPLGTGLDNLGDRRARKRSMLETYVPWAEAHGAVIASETTAIRVVGARVHGGRQTATHVLVRTPLGLVQRVQVNKAVVLAAGVVASSHFLQRSGCGGPVGTKVACNFALPMAYKFETEMKAFDGTQITLGARKPMGGAIFETYFNPPATFALSLPFRLRRHRQAMCAYPFLANFGALVGSQLGGTVSPLPDPILGTSLQWDLQPGDVENIKYALKTLVRLGHHAGAIHAWVPTEPGIELDLDAPKVDALCKALDAYPLQMSDLRLSTAHPQGGNRWIGEGSPHKDERTVDERFRVVDWTNLYVADASVFPTGIRVNPQWTVMALSSLAMRSVLEDQVR